MTPAWRSVCGHGIQRAAACQRAPHGGIRFAAGLDRADGMGHYPCSEIYKIQDIEKTNQRNRRLHETSDRHRWWPRRLYGGFCRCPCGHGSDAGGGRPSGRDLPQCRLHPHQDPQGFGRGPGDRPASGRVRHHLRRHAPRGSGRCTGPQGKGRRHFARRSGKDLCPPQSAPVHWSRQGAGCPPCGGGHGRPAWRSTTPTS